MKKEFSGEKSGEKERRQKEDKTEKVMGVERRTREEIVQWNQMTSLRFHTWVDIRHPRPPFRVKPQA